MTNSQEGARTAEKRARKSSPAMVSMLKHLAAGSPWYTGLVGRSEHGGGQKTLYALKARGYIDHVGSCNVTDAGRQMLEDAK